MKKKLYISLPISGYKLDAVLREAATYKALWQDEGYEVLAPFDLSPESDKPYSYQMG